MVRQQNPHIMEDSRAGNRVALVVVLFSFSTSLGNAALRTTFRAKEIDDFLVSTGIAIASDAVHIPATIIALILVRQIYEMQMSHVQYRI